MRVLRSEIPEQLSKGLYLRGILSHNILSRLASHTSR